MSELKFSGTATLTGFPRDRSFNFELDGPDRLVIKAGKEIFLVIEKEAAPIVVPDIAKAAESHIVAPQAPEAPVTAAPEAPPEAEATGRKPRGPNVKIDESLLIYIDINKPNPYGKLRGKYYETLKTAIGRPVSWWKETSMVKSLEGSPLTLLKFFLSEETVQLRPAAEPTQGAPIQPNFGGQPVPGAAWTPAGNVPPNGAPPASFM